MGGDLGETRDGLPKIEVGGRPMHSFTQRRKSVYNFGGQILRKLGKVQVPKARSCHCQRKEDTTRASGARRKLPRGVWGGAPEADAIFNILCQNGVHFWIC